ncbi:ABC transporter ATP-binding protein [Pseudonocardia nigra]|uniref:ABC transporter ATP-binding protein n=1 Tax=Pseudonocardia nigra TaxID=1921578 RepID=UPI0027E3628B|nr:ABC transporter ATP-binding protein [Pseudonocardia nigra]
MTAEARAPGGGVTIEVLLDVEEPHTRFPVAGGVVRAVDGVSLQLAQGRTLGIVGESGSGKSVLIRSIMGLLPRRGVHTSGSVRLAGRSILDLTDDELSRVWGREIGLVPQDPQTALNPVLRVGRQLAEPLRRHLGMGRREAKDRAAELLAQVRVPDPRRRLDQFPHELSGGLRQRVAIAMAIACCPRLLLADEPTTALDVTVQAQILDLLADIITDQDMSMILVTHDLAVIANCADEVAVMYAGKIVERAPTAALFQDVRMPYTEALLESIPLLSHPSHTRLRSISGAPPDPARRPSGCPFHPRCPYARTDCARAEPTLQPADLAEHEFACWFPVSPRGVTTAPAEGKSV